MSSSSASYVKVCKSTFSTGTMAMYVNTTTSPKEREIEGKVLLKLAYPSFVKGVWIKLVGTNSVSSENLGVLSHDLFYGDEDHHKDGLHQVLIGFGEGDNSHGTYLEMGAGRHSWPFHFKLPYYAPGSYFDGSLAISYKLVAIIDSPLVQSSTNRLILQHDHIAMNYSHFSYVRLKESQVTENRELLQKGTWLVAPKGSMHAGGGLLPSIMNALRTPVTLSISGSRTGLAGVPVGASGANCALFPFQTKQYEYEVLCSLSNMRSKNTIFLKSELYVEVSTRSSPMHAFPVHYPQVIGMPNSAADELGSVANVQQNKPYTSTRTHLIWTGSTEVAPADVEQVSIQVPVSIDADQRTLAFSHKPYPLPLLQASNAGKIIHYSVEAPLFRYRIMLKVSALRGDTSRQPLCAPVYGELYVLPPLPETETLLPPVAAAAPLSVRAGIPRLPTHTSTVTTTAAAGPASTSTQPVGVAALPSILTDVGSLLLRADATEETMGPSPVRTAGGGAAASNAVAMSNSVRRNSRGNHVNIMPPAEALPQPQQEQPQEVAETSSRRGSRPSVLVANGIAVAPTSSTSQIAAPPVSANPEQVTAITTSAAVALAPTRPASGSSSRSSRGVRNHGGVANFRATAAGANVNTVSNTTPSAGVVTGAGTGAGAGARNDENSHPNVVAAKTPHAKPMHTRTSHVIKVEAELLSRGPAAVVIDRNERRNDPIRTPQRFAFMYQVGVANVIEGTPIITAPTPVMISTGEYHAARRLYHQSNDGYCNNINGSNYSEPSTPAGALATVASAYDSATPGAADVVAGDGVAGGGAVGGSLGSAATPGGNTGAHSEGFHFYNLESATGTPQPPLRHRGGEHSIDSPSFADVDTVVAMPLPVGDDDAEADAEEIARMDATTHSTSRQRRLFQNTFDGVDWLVRNATTGGVDGGAAVDTERAADTSRIDDEGGNNSTLHARMTAEMTPRLSLSDGRETAAEATVGEVAAGAVGVVGPLAEDGQVTAFLEPATSERVSAAHAIVNLPAMVC